MEFLSQRWVLKHVFDLTDEQIEEVMALPPPDPPRKQCGFTLVPIDREDSDSTGDDWGPVGNSEWD